MIYVVNWKNEENPIVETSIDKEKNGKFFIMPCPRELSYGVEKEDVFDTKEQAVKAYKHKKLKDYEQWLDDCIDPPKIERSQVEIEASKSFGVLVDSTLRDSRGELVDFPKVGGYYDKALQRRFETKREKVEYMKKNKLAMDGSFDKKHVPVEAGTARKGKPIYFT